MITTITGGSGFIGSALAKRLQTANITVRPNENNPPGNKVAYDNLPPTDVLIHLAANTSTTDQDAFQMYQHNTNDPLAMFVQAIERGCKKIVYASSCAVYGAGPTPFTETQRCWPLNVYGQSKLSLETYAQRFADQEITIIGLRFSNVYGLDEGHKGKAASMVYRIGQQMKEGNPAIYFDGTQRRDWVFIEDVVDAILLATEKGSSGIYNIASGQSVTFNDVVTMWNEALGLDRKPVYIHNVYEKQYQAITEVDISKAKRELGYEPKFDLRKGIAAMLAK